MEFPSSFRRIFQFNPMNGMDPSTGTIFCFKETESTGNGIGCGSSESRIRAHRNGLFMFITEACGFMVKPLTEEGVREQLKKLRYPLRIGGADE